MGDYGCTHIALLRQNDFALFAPKAYFPCYLCGIYLFSTELVEDEFFKFFEVLAGSYYFSYSTVTLFARLRG